MRTEVSGKPGSSQFDGGIIPKGAKGYTACLTCPQSPAFHFGHLPPLHFFCTLGLARCLQYSSSTCLPSFDKQYTLRCFWPLPQETEHCKYKVTTDQLSHSYRGHGYPGIFFQLDQKAPPQVPGRLHKAWGECRHLISHDILGQSPKNASIKIEKTADIQQG